MTANRNKGVPGVPLGALDAIADENTRMVLRAMVDGWHVRNGHAGDGKAAFVTRDEIPDLAKTVIKNYIGGSSSSYANDTTLPTPSDISKAIADIQASIFESQLYKDLTTQVAMIDLGLVTEQQARMAAVAQVAGDLSAETSARLGFDEVVGSRVSTLETLTDTQAERITGLTTRVDGAESTILDLSRTTESQATSLRALTTRVGDNESNISALQVTTATQAQSLTSLTTRMTGAESNITQLNATTAGQATSLSSLQTRVSNAESAISTEATTRANADNALANTISTQFTQVNQSIAAIQTTQTTLSNSVSSLTTSSTTLQASVDGLTTSLAAEASARASADGNLYAQYTVKIDVNGHVTGFGLASESVNGKTKSAFIIRADKFAIVSPTSTDNSLTNSPSADSMPFAVANGITYIKSAAIQDASITNAKIKNLELESGKLRDFAITFSSSCLLSTRILQEGNKLEYVSVPGAFVTVVNDIESFPVKCIIWVSVDATQYGSSADVARYRILKTLPDGSVSYLPSAPNFKADGQARIFAFTYEDASPGFGTNTYQLQTIFVNSAQKTYLDTVQLVATLFKR